MKKIFILLTLCILFNIQTVYADYLPYTEPAVEQVCKKTVVLIDYSENKNVRTDAVFCNGRLCIPIDEALGNMGGEWRYAYNVYSIRLDGRREFFTDNTGSNRPEICVFENKVYISVYELAETFGYCVSADIDRNKISILKSSCSSVIPVSAGKGKAAYIRLEDIAADGMDKAREPKYTADMLLKLRFTAQYLYERGQEYYVAWIPVYADPDAGYWNDVSKDFSLYNSYFLYVMDYMADHGGHIGLHGYTHQYGSTVSGEGWEWGSKTLYGISDQQKRMVLAKQCAARLGYNTEFFEFPHYGATDSQLLMAEHYFDAVYQSFPNESKKNILTYTERSGKRVYYIPTPAGYVINTEDNGIFGKMASCYENGWAMSLYYHPVIDKDYISVSIKNDGIIWYYSPNGKLPEIVNRATELGYSFSTFR